MGQSERRITNNSDLRAVTEVQKKSALAPIVYDHTGSMGSHSLDNDFGYKRKEVSEYNISGFGNHLFRLLLKRPTAMAEAKLILIFLDGIFYTLFGYTLYINLSTWKSDTLFVLSGLFILSKIVFFIVKQYQDMKLRNQTIRNREIDLEKKEEEI